MPLSLKSFICCFILLIVAQDIFAQKFILLQKGSNIKTRLKYEIGEEFTYMAKPYDFYITDVIVDITHEAIILRENILIPKDIIAVDISAKDQRNRTITNLSNLGYGAGALIFLGTGVNGLIQEGSFLGFLSAIDITAVFVASGFLISKLKYKKFKHEGKNKIQLIILELGD